MEWNMLLGYILAYDQNELHVDTFVTVSYDDDS